MFNGHGTAYDVYKRNDKTLSPEAKHTALTGLAKTFTQASITAVDTTVRLVAAGGPPPV